MKKISKAITLILIMTFALSGCDKETASVENNTSIEETAVSIPEATVTEATITEATNEAPAEKKETEKVKPVDYASKGYYPGMPTADYYRMTNPPVEEDGIEVAETETTTPNNEVAKNETTPKNPDYLTPTTEAPVNNEPTTEAPVNNEPTTEAPKDEPTTEVIEANFYDDGTMVTEENFNPFANTHNDYIYK